MKDSNQLFYEAVGQRIKEIRIQKGMSQADLAERSHLSLPMISRIENAHTNMWLTTFAKIAEALQVPTDEILRLDIPASATLYPSEFAKILEGCTTDEIESILKISREVKASLAKQKQNIID